MFTANLEMMRVPEKLVHVSKRIEKHPSIRI
jgi:hypothetical protein